ncbi:peptide deformylase [Streptomyces sp. cg36]|uniref:peptide deformylase n=1 Tax=Streptomyces sp. cg36 TaxID=3238798 RepID=UPI0034E268EF
MTSKRPADSDKQRTLPAEADGGTWLPITEIGHPLLHRRCADVTEFGGGELAQLIKDMFFTMHVAGGVGLAANQVGVDLRLFVYDCPDDTGTRHIGHVLNPELVVTGEERIDRREGCLSVPGAASELSRPAGATVSGQDWQGRPVTVRGTGLFARCLQHESDHVGGVLYVDRIPAVAERDRVLRQMHDHRATVYAEREARARSLAR